MAIATKNTSKKFLWLGAMIAEALRGTFSPPEICTRNHNRSTTVTTRTMHQYSGRDTPRSRAYACALRSTSRIRPASRIRSPASSVERDGRSDPPELSALSAVEFGSVLNPDHRVYERLSQLAFQMPQHPESRNTRGTDTVKRVYSFRRRSNSSIV